jgi:hypothetical protein
LAIVLCSLYDSGLFGTIKVNKGRRHKPIKESPKRFFLVPYLIQDGEELPIEQKYVYIITFTDYGEGFLALCKICNKPVLLIFIIDLLV